MEQFDIEQAIIFECVTGSKLYGTDTEKSDSDFRGVCLPPMYILLNPFEGFQQKDGGFEQEDRCIYNLSKFMKLCADGNPNIIEMLFVPDDKVITSSWEWDKIIKFRSLFLSSKVRFTFSGYGFSQLNAIKAHRKWFIDAPKKKPTRKDFGLTDNPIISGDNLENSLNMNKELFNPDVYGEIQREREYRSAKKSWDNYISWRDNRNPERREMEDKWGYDCKHASHLIRLMTEGRELLLTGKITFPLENAEEIKCIRNGKYSYEQIIEMAESMDGAFEIWYNKSPLPHSPNRNAITDLYLSLIMEQ